MPPMRVFGMQLVHFWFVATLPGVISLIATYAQAEVRHPASCCGCALEHKGYMVEEMGPWQVPPAPADRAGTGVLNARRLAALHRLGLLDSPPDAAFDRLTRLVTRLLGVPVSLVSLLDSDRQFFKSALGLPEPWASRRETPLSHSFCQYVVDSGEPLIVEDAPHHPVVCTNLAIPDLQVNAYLGVPLTTADGMVLGSLCAIDTVPRAWSADDIALVRDLAAAVVTEIELRRDIIERQRAEAALYESTTRFGGAFNHAAIVMALVWPDGRWLQVNPALCGLVGYSEPELLTTSFQQITHPDDLDTDLAFVEQMLRGEIASYQMEKRYIHKDGHTLWALLSVSLVRDIHGAPQYFVSQIQDITQRRLHEAERQALIDQLLTALDERDTALRQSSAALQRTESLYELAGTLSQTQVVSTVLQTMVESAARTLPAHRVVLITVDTATRRVEQQLEAGPGARHVAPLTFDELTEGLSGVVLREGQPVLSLKGTPDSRESEAVQQRRIYDQAGSILVAPIQIRGTMLGTVTAINAPDQADFTPPDVDLLLTLANHAAVAIERTMLLAELQELATRDALTGLLNRRAWREQSERLVVLAERSGSPLSVALLDADRFKRINDTYGHAAGDRALQAISACVQQSVRRSDVVGRYGGEELVVLLPETDSAAAEQVAERMRRQVADEVIDTGSQTLRVTVSVGIATAQGGRIDLDLLLGQADQALYEAKEDGRDCVRAFAQRASVTISAGPSASGF
jgi:diguanylate cyclase